ncbi:hypothetical protein [Pseudomonas sp. 8O]|uniref:hypothetical protein n=1 Tax=Pseudomonas sp. 8O TaxID=2653165 RepID=UPI0012F2396C|nr:hypothetical protein [Pseudomonas sp. 8O]VXC46522.1 conserved hypothetical protein [Pseudomonas sp. 8O]
MLIVDRVLCDCCGQPMGQLYNQPAPQADLLPDLTRAPHVTLCPDCQDMAEVLPDPSPYD